ncbi:MAG TPA: LamG domain-containing protein, partial [bacterium]|nr:LamG domain-containing protein [bacterium]
EFIKFTPTQFEFHANAVGTDNLNYPDIPTGVWMHHVVVKNGPVLIYYRNGVVVGTQPQTLELNNPQPLFMGGDNEGAAGENWTGYLDNVRIYNEALSPQAVLQLYLSEGPASVNPAEWEAQH